MKWENTFELNIKEFDDHHRHLVGLMNSLHANLISGASDETLGVFVGKLTDYAIYHFSAEEHWMDEHRYPGYIEHRDEHITFVNKICEFQKDLYPEYFSLSRRPLGQYPNRRRPVSNCGNFGKALLHRESHRTGGI